MDDRNRDLPRAGCSLWPPHSTTSPKSTSRSAKVSPVEQAKAMASPPAESAEAAVGGSAWRHSPAAEAVAAEGRRHDGACGREAEERRRLRRALQHHCVAVHVREAAGRKRPAQR